MAGSSGTEGRRESGSGRSRRRGPYKGDLREAGIRSTLEGLLRKKPLREIEVEELAHGAGISRPTFYFYFESKAAALASLTVLVLQDMYAAANEPAVELEPYEDIRTRISASARLWREQGHVLRAAVQTWDAEEDTRQLYEEGISYFVEALRRRIRHARRNGLAPEGPPSALALARSLVWMSGRCFYTNSLGSSHALSDEELIDTITTVWYRSIYCGG